jgi:tetratricopeptide (TPR) repeat protein
MRRIPGARMRNLMFITAWISAFIAPRAPAFSDQADDALTLRQRTHDAVMSMNNLDFSAADKICGELKTKFADEPHASFLESYKYFWRFYLSGDEESRTNEFRASIQRLLEQCSSKNALHEEDRLLFLACAHFFMAAILREEGRSGAALIEIGAMGSAASNLLRRHQGLPDGLFITGATLAYSARVPVQTADLVAASKTGYYLAPMAGFVLAEALADANKDYNAALPVYKSLVADFPGNALFRFHLAQTYERMDLLQESLDAYGQVLPNLHLRPPALQLVCRTHFAEGQILERQGKFSEAITEYEKSLSAADESEETTKWFVPWSNLQIGRCLEKVGKLALSLSYLEGVRKETDPDAYGRAQALAAEIRARVDQGRK